MRSEKRLEQTLLVFHRYTDTVILYTNNTNIVFYFRGKLNKSVLSGIFNSIGYQINDAALNQMSIQIKHAHGTGMLVNNVLILFTNHLHLLRNLFSQLH